METCRDCGEPADPEYTMDFTDVEPGAYIYWCAVCGPEAKRMNDALDEAFKTRPGFAKELELAIDKAEQEIH
ncbi:MAG: hypothetical protein OK454_01800 [Thaumarchaeota archaeon]|nr:hypothetical protein [Nitrososphaerota archaeon]